MTERAAKSKIYMEAGSVLFDGINNIDDKCFESYATHADTPKLVTEKKSSKVWQVSNEVAK